MSENQPHITEYKTLANIFLILIFLVLLTVSVSSLNLAPYSVTVALLIAGVKAFLVLSYFMHLKYENTMLRVLVAMVFVIYTVIVLITFIDYAYR